MRSPLCRTALIAASACSGGAYRAPAVLAGGQAGVQVPVAEASAAPAPPSAAPAIPVARSNEPGAAAAGVSAGAPGAAVQGAPAAATASGSALGACSLPHGADPAVAHELYAKWKADLLTTEGAGGFARVRRPNSGTQLNSSNSEGIAYGMLSAVYTDDQPTFDALWQYEQLHRGKNGLMEWEIAPDGKVLGSGAASDGDEDMAFALVMADARWHGRGALPETYLNYAKTQIDLIWRFEVDHARGDVFMAGDQFDGAQVINISYFAPAFYRVFGDVSGRQADWQRVTDASYRVLSATLNAANKNADNGLVPAWSTPEGVPMAPPGSGHPRAPNRLEPG